MKTRTFEKSAKNGQTKEVRNKILSKKNCPSHILELLHGKTTRDYEFIRFFKNIFFSFYFV